MTNHRFPKNDIPPRGAERPPTDLGRKSLIYHRRDLSSRCLLPLVSNNLTWKLCQSHRQCLTTDLSTMQKANSPRSQLQQRIPHKPEPRSSPNLPLNKNIHKVPNLRKKSLNLKVIRKLLYQVDEDSENPAAASSFSLPLNCLITLTRRTAFFSHFSINNKTPTRRWGPRPEAITCYE